MTDQPITRWITRTQNAAAVFYTNQDTEATLIAASVHHGPLALLRTRVWAWRRYGRLEVRR